MCTSSNSNITFACKICNTNIKDTESAVQSDICQFWIRMKCKFNLNLINYKYLQVSNDPWFCISCCNEIFPSGTLADKSNDDFDTTDINSTSLVLKPSAKSLLFNQFNNFSPEPKK